MIQFRDKKLDDRSFANTATTLLSLTRAAGIPLIINDRVAIAIGADGVHVGRHDGDVCKIRALLPPEMVFGVSAVNFNEAVAMDEIGADYLGVGPVFPTLSKEDATPSIGTEQLNRICNAVKTNVVAIGGMNMETLPRAIQAGVAGAAVISAVSHAADMVAAARNLIDIWEQKD
jgi:thiamine-phosphate pyrophosphorylase